MRFRGANLFNCEKGLKTETASERSKFDAADRTRFIEAVDEYEYVNCVIRYAKHVEPAFLTMLKNYYDKAAQAEFVDNFQGTYIALHKTRRAGQYCVLYFDLTRVSLQNTNSDVMERVREGLTAFCRRYGVSNWNPKSDRYPTPQCMLGEFERALSGTAAWRDEKIYVIVNACDQNDKEYPRPEELDRYRESCYVLRLFFGYLKSCREQGHLFCQVLVAENPGFLADCVNDRFSVYIDFTDIALRIFGMESSHEWLPVFSGRKLS